MAENMGKHKSKDGIARTKSLTPEEHSKITKNAASIPKKA